MIMGSVFRAAGGLEQHLLSSESNECVIVRKDHFRGAEDLHTALRMMEGLSRANSRAKRCFVHFFISPGHALTEDEFIETMAMIEAEFGISVDALRAVVEHEKGDRPNHFHIVYSIFDPLTGRAVKSHENFAKDELICRRLELKFGEEILAGHYFEQNIAELRRRGLDQEANHLADVAYNSNKDGLTREDRQQAKRVGADPWLFDREVFEVFKRSGRELATFATAIDKTDIHICLGDDAVLALDGKTGYSTSLTKLLRREASHRGELLSIKERDVAASFLKLPSKTAARETGFARATVCAQDALEKERRWAFIEATREGDIEEFIALREAKIKEISAARYSEIQATLKARREKIVSLYRARDEIRRRRVDRAFKLAGIFARGNLHQLLFTMAAAGIVLTGGSVTLGLALGAGLAIMSPSFARARQLAATSRVDRAADALARSRDLAQAKRMNRSRSALGDKQTRFGFDQVAKPDRILAGALAAGLLKGGGLANVSGDAATAMRLLKPDVAATIVNLMETGSRRQIEVVTGWYARVAEDRRVRAIDAAKRRLSELPIINEGTSSFSRAAMGSQLTGEILNDQSKVSQTNSRQSNSADKTLTTETEQSSRMRSLHPLKSAKQATKNPNGKRPIKRDRSGHDR